MGDSGVIYLIPTPIGNLGDITQRALDVLSEVDLIACEDTRHSGSLLKKFDIKKPLVSYHEFNERSRAESLIEKVKNGTVLGVITDAGSPGVSDPAYRVVRTAIDNNILIIPLPGATALVPALTASGLPTDRFFFEGFLSHKSAARKKRLAQLKELEHTIIFYESPHRIAKMLADLFEIMGDREICLAREISKKFEEFLRGTVSDIIVLIEKKPIKGEIVVVVEGNK